jgi:hypothetical protein
LGEDLEARRRRYHEGVLGALFALFFLSTIAGVFALVPGFYGYVVGFFADFVVTQVPNTGIQFVAPAVPAAHTVFYDVVGKFCLIWGLALFFILAVRFVVRSPTGKKAETLSSIVFWLGAYYVVSTYLNAATTTTLWFVFWSVLAMVLGASLIMRAGILAIARRLSP